MNAKFTPGPWVRSRRTIQSESGTICETFSHLGIAEADANERLIAAAPDLIEAAQKAIDECCDLIETDAGRALVAAIAKATGEPQ